MDNAHLGAVGHLGLVGVVKTAAGLQDDAASDVLGHLAQALGGQLADLRHRQARDVLHGDEVLAIDLAQL